MQTSSIPLSTVDIDRKSGEMAAAPRVTLDHINQRIAKREYQRHGVSTICILTMVNGFKVFGHSTPASPENFREDLGMEYALDNAIRQLWQLEGYLLRERITNPLFDRPEPVQ